MTGTFDRRLVVLSAFVGALFAVLGAGPTRADAEVSAGAAVVDASWHVGASAGQYAGDCATDPAEDVQQAAEDGDPSAAAGPVQDDACAFGVDPADGTYDPTFHSYRRQKSYGLQARLDVRALVVRGEGAPVAIVKTNQYIPQDLLYRRAAQLLEASDEDCGVTRQTLTMAATHDHSSPMYSSTSWGVWAFQDVFDVRFYNYLAGRIADAVSQACGEMVPVRVGAAVGEFDKTHRHSFGPALADDGTPAGYPNSETDHDMTVIRFDDAATGEPVANLVNYSLHPEFLEGNDLLSADYVAPLERMTDRATGAVTIYTQGAVGTSEPERSTFHDVHERLEFTHKDYAQAEYAASLMSHKVVEIRDSIASGNPEDPSRFVPFTTEFPVQMTDKWYPGPLSHPYPGVSNCRTDKAIGGDPQLPVAGLPDCQGLEGGLRNVTDEIPGDEEIVNNPETDPGLDTDDFEQAGIPVPENYSAPGYTGLEEDIDIHLQGIRLGEIYLPICSCEQWFDQSKNIESRTDKVAGNEWLGYDWGAQCTPLPDSQWSCPNPGSPSAQLPPISDHEYQRMRAQVNEPANGWNDPDNVLFAESEDPDLGDPGDPDDDHFWGNYTHDDDADSAADGYTLTVPISMANDYNGYIATYREYQRGDHYRKALTGWGPHSSDYMASRLVAIGRRLKDPDDELPADQQFEENLQPKVMADQAVNDARAEALGEVGGQAIDAYEAALPDDGGDAEAVEQPKDEVERFGTAFFTWNGGSNYTDDPEVRVERKIGDEFEPYADQSGEVPVTLEFPKVDDGPAFLAEGQHWRWTAHFEAFVAPFDVGSRIATPAGTYRFVVEGVQRKGGAEEPYEIRSDEFEVKPWSGITVEDLREDPDGRVSFDVGPTNTYDAGGAVSSEVGPIDYPDTYDDPQKAKFIRDQRTAVRDPAAPNDGSKIEWYCLTCSFRPWLDAGDAQTASVTFVGADGHTESVPATHEGGRWVSERALGEGESAYVGAGCVADEYGNYDGSGSAGAVGASSEPPADAPSCLDQPAGEPPPTDPPPSEPPPGSDGSGDGALPGPGPDAGDPGALPAPGPSQPACERGSRRDEKLTGTDGPDCLAGGRGDDRLKGGAGDDRLIGGPGDDVIVGGQGADAINCGPGGRDVARTDRSDAVKGCERIRGRG